MGCEASQKVRKIVTGTMQTDSGQKICEARDRRRVERSQQSAQRGHKTARRKLKMVKTIAELKKNEAEGQLYGAGQF